MVRSSAESGHVTCEWPLQHVQGWRAIIRNGRRMAALVSLSACLGAADLRASEPVTSHGPTIQRSMRVIPRRFVLSPNGVTIAANQTQRFGVTDADGNAVAVRWNVSGLGCYGASCGSIDEEGVYRPPASLPQPRLVTVEGVVISDPHYSVQTEIRLEDKIKTTADPAAAQGFSGEPQLLALQAVKRPDIASRTESIPLPAAIAAAPGVESLDVARTSTDVALAPSVVNAAPTVSSEEVSPRKELPPVPSAITATPEIGSGDSVRTASLPLVPSVVPAAPSVGAPKIASRTEPMPLPRAVAAAPAVGGSENVRSVDLVLAPTVVLTAPKAGTQTVGTQKIASRQVELMPVPRAAAPAPAIEPRDNTRATGFEPLPSSPRATSPAPAQVVAVKTQAEPATLPSPSNGSGGVALQPLPIDAPTAQAKPPTRDGARVTYRQGQLTIDAQNSTLAEVLKLVAEKTGATIEVPPGAGLERIVVHVGPGSPNDVLTQLLNGSQFNFIIVNSPQRPEDLAQVLLTLRQGDTDTPAPAPEPKALVSSNAPTPFKPRLGKPDGQPDLSLLNSLSVKAPTDPVPPEARGELMKEMARELREKLQQQNPPQ